MLKKTIVQFLILLSQTGFSAITDMSFGYFERVDGVNPIISPNPDSTFYCPVQNKEVNWESDHTFNPAAVVRNGEVYLIYRAEDHYGNGIGNHTSRLGLAISSDGIHFQRYEHPVFFPTNDEQKKHEFPGGCEDPRIVETEEGTYVMTYTQWNRDMAVLGIATSDDLFHWKKHGYAFAGSTDKIWSKSGSIICRREKDRLIATKIQGKYWMYWGEGNIYIASSEDLISWKPRLDDWKRFHVVMTPRQGKFDSHLVEPGPPAILSQGKISLLYNGKNAPNGDPSIPVGAYSAGQLILDGEDPAKILMRSEDCFLTPQEPYEMKGQYQGGTVFIEGLVHFQGNWLLYYGTADSAVGVARYRPQDLPEQESSKTNAEIEKTID